MQPFVAVKNILILKLVCLSSFLLGGDNFGIVEPLPENIYPSLFSSAQVTCVAYDSAGVKIPEKILFMRKDQFAQYHELKPNDNLYFTNRTEGWNIC